MRHGLENRLAELLAGLVRLVQGARTIPGVCQISPVAPIRRRRRILRTSTCWWWCSDGADLVLLARHARRLQGHAQSLNRGADVFLANERSEYIGRTCR
jgi:hypothetical protein